MRFPSFRVFRTRDTLNIFSNDSADRKYIRIKEKTKVRPRIILFAVETVLIHAVFFCGEDLSSGGRSRGIGSLQDAPRHSNVRRKNAGNLCGLSESKILTEYEVRAKTVKNKSGYCIIKNIIWVGSNAKNGNTQEIQMRGILKCESTDKC